MLAKKMKKLYLLLFLFCASVHVMAQDAANILGSWTGKLDLGQMSLTVVLNFEQANGDVVCTLDSPDQGAKGIAASKEFLSNDSVSIRIESIGATYRARVSGSNLEGVFTQRGYSFPLNMTKGKRVVNRPQHPQPPYPYTTEEVTFRNEKDGATLAGTITYPVGYNAKQKPPVVLLVSGSGQQNRDEELMEHKPFLVIADYLARNGIATLRYDDRATAASVGGDVQNATTEDFMRDAAAGIDFLRGLKKFKQIGCLGHSEGASIAFMLASRKKADFIVSMAGIGVKGDTALTAQSNRLLELSGLSSSFTVKDYREMLNAQPAVKWIQWFIDYDPSDDIRNTRCPVFALNGSSDCQVISSLNLRAIEQLLPSAKKNLIKEYPSLNHLFQHCTTGLPAEYGQIEETISPEVLRDMAEWINYVN